MASKDSNDPKDLREGHVVIPATPAPGRTKNGDIGKDGSQKQDRGHNTIPITPIQPPDKKKK